MSLKILAMGVSPLRVVVMATLLASPLMFSGCGSDEDKAADYVERPVDEIYNDAWQKLKSHDWVNAGKQFDEVERQHPYSIWARRSTLMAAYSYYQGSKYQDAIDTADRFIQLHPGNKDAVYAYYLKAVSLYEEIVDVGRDQGKTEAALAGFQDLVQRFPGTEYARDAQLKIDLTRDHLAGKEMEIGRYYLRQGQYIAAINRFRLVVEKYQTTSHVPEALERLTECYMSLGIVKEAQTAAAVLGFNYPGTDWYKDSYALLTEKDLAPREDKDSWISKAFRAVF